MDGRLPVVKGLSKRGPGEKDEARKNDRETHRRLKLLLKRPGNGECADCRTKCPGWASLPHGVHICIDCAQVHRHIGRHISQVKAITTGTYLWYADEYDAMEFMGNNNAARLYLGRHPDGLNVKVPASASRAEREKYIREKYEQQRWVLPPGEPFRPQEEAAVAPCEAARPVRSTPEKRKAVRLQVKPRSQPKAAAATDFEDFADWPGMDDWTAPAPIAPPAPTAASNAPVFIQSTPAYDACNYEARRTAILSLF
mmetsp:Transcript_22802/g.64094  ORF Transcript_22802/g.64094 Transcript_22802/m.64094 type:complete len:255 (+) Transcript_22802:129-893(+)